MDDINPQQDESEQDGAQFGTAYPQSLGPEPSHSDDTLGEDIPWARPAYIAPCPDYDPMLLRGSSRVAALADLGILFVLLVVGLFVVQGALFALPGRFGLPLDPHEFDHAIMLVGIMLQAVLCCAAVALVVRYRRQSAMSLGVNMRYLGRNVAIGVATLAVIFGMNYVAVMLMYLLKPSLIEQLQTNQDNLRNLIPKMNLAKFFALTVVVAFYEELVCRGFLLPRLRRCLGNWVPAVVLSSVIFAVPHMLQQEPLAVFFLGIMGIILSLVTIWRRSLVPAITAHFLFNSWGFVYLFYLS